MNSRPARFTWTVSGQPLSQKSKPSIIYNLDPKNKSTKYQTYYLIIEVSPDKGKTLSVGLTKWTI